MTTSKKFTMPNGSTVNALLTKSSLLTKTRSGTNSHSHSKETLLCLSGFGCSHYNFTELAKDLGDQFQMVLIDNRGMGESDKAESEYELDDLADDAVEVMKQLSIDHFHVIGISMGGFIAQLIAVKYPERVKSLSLLCTSSGGDDFISLPITTEEGLRQFYSLSEPYRTEVAVEATVHPTLKESNFGRFQSICELRRAHPADVDEVLKQKRAVDRFLAKSIDLSKIACPTFILSGENDRFVSPENSKRLYMKIAESKIFIVELADHFFFLERPRKVAQIVKSNLLELKADNAR